MRNYSDLLQRQRCKSSICFGRSHACGTKSHLRAFKSASETSVETSTSTSMSMCEATQVQQGTPRPESASGVEMSGEGGARVVLRGSVMIYVLVTYVVVLA